MKKTKRTTGQILLDIEPLLLELVDQELQWSDILALVHVWLSVHAPQAQETYTSDGSHPEFYYGPKRRS